jgi:hypothetical protein
MMMIDEEEEEEEREGAVFFAATTCMLWREGEKSMSVPAAFRLSVSHKTVCIVWRVMQYICTANHRESIVSAAISKSTLANVPSYTKP